MKVLLLLLVLIVVAVSVHGYSFTSYTDSETTPVKISADLTVDEENRIAGGMDADLVNYPYVASVRINGVTVCVATLIAPQYLVTTAHCIRTNEHAMTASFDVEYDFGTDGEVVKIVKGFKHPLYNRRTKVYDVGLLKLEMASKEKVAALPAADGSDEKVGTMATVLGWRLADEGTSSFKLQQANLPIISEAECGKFNLYKSQLTKGMLCAGNGNGKGSCRGDAGGPLMVNDVLVGFVSWAEGKCGNVPGVYTRVSYVLDYIKDIVEGGDGKRFGPARTSSDLLPTKDVETGTVGASPSTKTTTVKPDATKTSLSFANLSPAAQKEVSTKASAQSNSGAHTESYK